jgi:hypothetical protein
MYVANYNNGNISKITISTGDIVTDWVTGLYGPFGLVINGLYLYVSNQGPLGSGNTISKITLSDGSVELDWTTLTYYGPSGLAIYGSYLYVAIYGVYSSIDTKISRINLSDGSIDNADWKTDLNGPLDLLVHDSYLYVSNLGDFGTGTTISKINLSTGSIEENWATGLYGPAGLAIDGSYMYVSNYGTNFISKLSLTNGSIIELNWFEGNGGPLYLVINGLYLYVSYISLDISAILRINLIPTPVSNICFPANTPIKTDQGTVEIYKIIPDKYTINNKPIIDITKTITNDNYLICFQKNALGLNYPTEKTVMSKHHKVYYKGKMIEAYKFFGHFENVHKINYDGEILYNVLMHHQSKINVNNMLCETLDPDNIIAKLYTRKCKYPEEVKEKIIVLLKQCIKKNDYVSYNKIVKNLK